LTVYMSNMAGVLYEAETAYPSRVPEVIAGFLVGSVLLTFSIFCAVPLCVFTFLVSCCDVHYDLLLKRCSVRFYLRYFVCACEGRGGGGSPCLACVVCDCLRVECPTHIMMCFSFFCLVVLCTQCCQFLWIDHFWLLLLCHLPFICLC
jgi:hypothetical protein